MRAFGAAIAGGIVVWLLAPAWAQGALRVVITYDAMAAILLAVNWGLTLRDDATHTVRRATAADPGRNVVLGIVLVSVLVGLTSAIVILGRAAVPPAHHVLASELGILAVILGWFLIHTTFIFRYAHLYYYDDPDDKSVAHGLTFPGTSEPDDFDFAYFSFVVGMTFQVSDVQITDPGVRRIVLFHGIISFGYNTAILALGVNLISNLLNTH